MNIVNLTEEKRQEFLWQLQKDAVSEQNNILAFLRAEHGLADSVKMTDICLASLQNIGGLTETITEECLSNPSFRDVGLELCARLDKIKAIPQNCFDLLAKDISIQNGRKVDLIKNTGAIVGTIGGVSAIVGKLSNLDFLQSLGAGAAAASAVFLIKPAHKIARATGKIFRKSSSAVCRHIEKNAASHSRKREFRSVRNQRGFTLLLG